MGGVFLKTFFGGPLSGATLQKKTQKLKSVGFTKTPTFQNGVLRRCRQGVLRCSQCFWHCCEGVFCSTLCSGRALSTKWGLAKCPKYRKIAFRNCPKYKKAVWSLRPYVKSRVWPLGSLRAFGALCCRFVIVVRDVPRALALDRAKETVNKPPLMHVICPVLLLSDRLNYGKPLTGLTPPIWLSCRRGY